MFDAWREQLDNQRAYPFLQKKAELWMLKGKKQSQTILKLINKELCFLSLIYDYILSYSNCPVLRDNGNQPLMNPIKYNTTSILRLPRDLSV